MTPKPRPRAEDIVSEHSFHQDLAGSRVGMVNVGEWVYPKGSDPTLYVDIAVASVDHSGADYIRTIHGVYMAGLVDIVELSGYVPAGRQTFYRDGHRISRYDPRKYAPIGGISRLESSKSPERRGAVEWVIGESQILQAIKNRLTSQSLEWAYASIYYQLAFYANLEQQLADPDMNEQTKKLIEEHKGIEARLQGLHEDDTTMRSNLTVFGELDAQEIPEAFEDTRETAHVREKEIHELQQASPLGDWYLPVGHRSEGGRSWPYMDATLGDERAYGRELEFLRQRDAAPVAHELKREIKELKSRIRRAEEIGSHLIALAEKEQLLAEAQGV